MTRRPGVSIDEIKQAFRLLAKRCHPDHGGNPALFSRLFQAYQVSLARALDGEPCPA
jgi:curved DNA-binding protein CbpA